MGATDGGLYIAEVKHWALIEHITGGLCSYDAARSRWALMDLSSVQTEFPLATELLFERGTEPNAVTHIREVYTDANGASDVARVYLLINDQLKSPHACFVQFDATSHLFWLISDEGLPHPGLIVAAGEKRIVQNGQCMLYGESSFAQLEGRRFTLNLAIGFKPSFSGIKSTYEMAASRRKPGVDIWDFGGVKRIVASKTTQQVH